MEETMDADPVINKLVSVLNDSLEDKNSWLPVGIANGGLQLTEILAKEVLDSDVCGSLNPMFHRDDIGINPVPKDFFPTSIPFEVNGGNILLIDDVFASGRTLRASLNELFDIGRPAKVKFATLFDLGRAVLPIRPDFVGEVVHCDVGQKLIVNFSTNSRTGATYHLI